MSTLSAKEIRQKFLDFFASKGHVIVPSAPLVIKNDPTLMFTNAGMNPFKDYFLGNKPAPNKRVADTQKCLRVSGKHNDLEDVGHDTYHHTLFEMLGNWSFGDYFKKEALEWSWELLTEVYGLPKDRLYVTVFEGDQGDQLPADDEARAIWSKLVPESQILYGNKKDNFWEMGDTGPCGPCSEIHIDLRSPEEVAQSPGRDWVNKDHPEVVEIWNNVFMEFNRLADGSLQKLPAQHVDTGMGFERLCMAIQGKKSNYDTDVFQPLIQFIAQASGKTYGAERSTDIAMRVLADHIRAISFAVADGQLPSNNKAGYVIRRILRRAVRYYFNFLGFKEPFLYKLVPLLAEQFDGVFPELKAQQDFVARVIEQEEVAFLKTLEIGLKRLDGILASAENKTVEGKLAFELYDTYGFPLDLTALIARENGYQVDEPGFEAEMKKQKDRSRNAAATETGDWVYLVENESVRFVGYDESESLTRITRYRPITAKGKTQYQIVLETTPFYAESGGQTGDTGTLTLPDSQVVLHISDTKKENDLILHLCEEEEAAEKLQVIGTGSVLARIDRARRSDSSANHSATHLLHAALRDILGTHVQQKGSLVSPEVLRFDFSHFEKVSDADLAQLETLVNEKIRANIPLLEERQVPIAEAQAKGAMALFGEKYGDKVRVITFDPAWSVELCGGTHVPSTGLIGLFKITSETSVAAGVRRIEALTSASALAYVNSRLALLDEVKVRLKNAPEPLKALDNLLEERSQLNKRVEALETEKRAQLREALLGQIESTGDIQFLAAAVDLPHADAVKQLAFELRQQKENLVAVLGANLDGKPHLAVILADSVVASKALDASKLVRELAKEIQGGGGGQPFFATAGGKDLGGLERALAKSRELFLSLPA